MTSLPMFSRSLDNRSQNGERQVCKSLARNKRMKTLYNVKILKNFLKVKMRTGILKIFLQASYKNCPLSLSLALESKVVHIERVI